MKTRDLIFLDWNFGPSAGISTIDQHRRETGKTWELKLCDNGMKFDNIEMRDEFLYERAIKRRRIFQKTSIVINQLTKLYRPRGTVLSFMLRISSNVGSAVHLQCVFCNRR